MNWILKELTLGKSLCLIWSAAIGFSGSISSVIPMEMRIRAKGIATNLNVHSEYSNDSPCLFLSH